jgi:hypothetical protein
MCSNPQYRDFQNELAYLWFCIPQWFWVSYIYFGYKSIVEEVGRADIFLLIVHLTTLSIGQII